MATNLAQLKYDCSQNNQLVFVVFLTYNFNLSVTAAELYFLPLIGFDITWTLYEVFSKKLCNSDASTWFLVVKNFGFVKQLDGLLE